MTEPNDNAALMEAVHAALDAGRAIMEVYRTVPEVELKADRSPLTLADKRAHETIRDRLARTPYPLLSEEGKAVAFDERRKWETYWLVDPLDGTKEFIRKNGEFTVNIALVRRGVPEGGVVYAPAKDLFYFALHGLGSFRLRAVAGAGAATGLGQLAGQADRLPVGTAERPYTVVASRSHLSDETRAFVRTLEKEHGEVSFISSGSSLKICLVAEGSADVYPRLAPTMEWDTAAGHAVARFAGKTVKRYGSDTELGYNKPDLLNPWFVVS